MHDGKSKSLAAMSGTLDDRFTEHDTTLSYSIERVDGAGMAAAVHDLISAHRSFDERPSVVS